MTTTRLLRRQRRGDARLSARRLPLAPPAIQPAADRDHFQEPAQQSARSTITRITRDTPEHKCEPFQRLPTPLPKYTSHSPIGRRSRSVEEECAVSRISIPAVGKAAGDTAEAFIEVKREAEPAGSTMLRRCGSRPRSRRSRPLAADGRLAPRLPAGVAGRPRHC